MGKRSFKVMDGLMEYGDINVGFDNVDYGDLRIIIPNAWEYETDVYEVLPDGELELIFNHNMEEDEYENLNKYGYGIVELDGYLYLKNIEDNAIWILEYAVDRLSSSLLKHGLEDKLSYGVAHEYILF